MDRRLILVRCWAIAALLCGPAGAQSLGERIEAVVRSSPAAERASWGIEVFDPATNKALFALNGDRLLLPASNVKLFTTALALSRLGPDYRFATRILASAAPDTSGRIAGDLILVGGGDAILSARSTPYKKGPTNGNPLRAVEELADKVAAYGVHRIDGDVIGDDTRYFWQPQLDGWTVDDAAWDFGAVPGALVVNDGIVTFTLRAGKAGHSPQVTVSPPLEWFSIDNRVHTGVGETKVQIERLAGSRQVRLWGRLAPGSETKLSFALDDPAEYAALALKDALERRGIYVRGHAVARHCYLNRESCEFLPAAQTGVEIARRESPALIEILRIIDKASLNVHAEALLREIGRAKSGIGTREAGLSEMRAFLTEIGIEGGAWSLADASGLSRYDLVTPDALVKLLAHMYRSPFRDQWLSLLPHGGEDGTLENRFAGSSAASHIRAKTGSLEHTAALSGYADTRTRGTLIFSIMVNDFLAPSEEKRALVDKIALLIASE